MKKYKIIVEVDFVSLESNGGKKKLGYFCTFFVTSNSAKGAVSKVGQELFVRNKAHHVLYKEHGLFKTRFLINNIWEVSEEVFSKNENGNGFSFFEITMFEAFFFVVRNFIIKNINPHMVIVKDALIN